MSRLGRNDPCHCGSGIKYKKCSLAKEVNALDPVWESLDLIDPEWMKIRKTEAKKMYLQLK